MHRHHTRWILGAAATTACAGVMGFSALLAPTAAQQPQPSNPSPRPANPSPQPANPSPKPADPSPQPSNPQPSNPSQPPANPQYPPINPKDRNNPNNPTSVTPSTTTATNRMIRPFMLQNPQDEARFAEASQKLVRFEQKLDKSNQDMLKRLGEIRQLSTDRQNGATMELLQQMLRNQAELQQYLVQARTAWTGDVVLAGESDAAPVATPQR